MSDDDATDDPFLQSVEGSLQALSDQLRRGDQQREGISVLGELVRQVRQDVASLHAEQIPDSQIPEATDELEQVVKATEKATNDIMDAAEAIEGLASQVGGDHGKQVTDEVMRIFEACTFQDITGQRVEKVVRALQSIEKKVSELLEMFGVENQTSDNKATDRDKKRSDEDLLSGPQLPENAKSQAEIDALFSSLD